MFISSENYVKLLRTHHIYLKDYYRMFSIHNRKPSLFLPIEIQSRELISKCLIALVAANNNFRVFIGWKGHIRLQPSFLPPGTVLEKSASPGTVGVFSELKRSGNKIFVLDEEGLLYLDPNSYIERRLSNASIEMVDGIFTWGNNSQKLISCAAPKVKVYMTGNPRIDLLNPIFRNIYQDKIKSINMKFKKYILINTSFGVCNWKKEDCVAADYINQMKERDKIHSQDHSLQLQNYFNYKKQNMIGFRNLTKSLALKYPDVNIVIRPHPSEDINYWSILTKSFPNIFVNTEHDSIPWMLAAKAVIQNDCTTGVEGGLMGCKVINFNCDLNHSSNFELVSSLTHSATTIDEVLVFLESGNSYDYAGHHRRVISEYIINWNGDKLAAEQIVELINEHNLVYAEKKLSPRQYLERIHNTYKLYLNKNYRSSKFPGINKDLVETTIKDLQVSIGSKSLIKVTQIRRDLFEITSIL